MPCCKVNYVISWIHHIVTSDNYVVKSKIRKFMSQSLYVTNSENFIVKYTCWLVKFTNRQVICLYGKVEFTTSFTLCREVSRIKEYEICRKVQPFNRVHDNINNKHISKVQRSKDQEPMHLCLLYSIVCTWKNLQRNWRDFLKNSNQEDSDVTQKNWMDVITSFLV